LHSGVDTPVNLGNPDERSILELAELIIELTDSESDITFEPLPPQDPQVRRPDISKAKNELDWNPSVELREGLERCIEYSQRVLET
jgi:dTDP-glucose 4,6-dehydratase